MVKDSILTDPTEEAVAESIYRNMYAQCAHYAQGTKVTKHEADDYLLYGLWWGGGRPQEWNVVTANIPSHLVEERIDEVQAFCNRNEAPLWWFVFPDTRPLDLGDRLKARGWNLYEMDPGMALNLANLMDDREGPEGLTVERVMDPESMRLFFRIWAEGYPLPKEMAEIWAEGAIELDLTEESPIKHYIGYLDGKPVATAWLSLGAGVAGLYGVVTLPEARGRGIGTEMTLVPLREAKAEGYHVATLLATKLGGGIYRRLGFKEYFMPVVYIASGNEG